jgi:hypothetical protein
MRSVSIRQHTSAYVSIRQHTPAYVSIRQEATWSQPIDIALCVAYVSIRQHTSAYVRRQPGANRLISRYAFLYYRNHLCSRGQPHVSIRQHTSAYVSIQQPTSAVLARATTCQHTSACARTSLNSSASVSCAREEALAPTRNATNT